jgi:hypothetical protein
VRPAALKKRSAVRFVTADGVVGTFTVSNPGHLWVEGELAGREWSVGAKPSPARLFRQWELRVGEKPDFQIDFADEGKCHWTGEPIISLELTGA